MAKNGYTVTHSNYTIKTRHLSSGNHVIYERDYMSTTNLGGYGGSTFPNEQGNFKFVYRNDFNKSRKRKYGELLKPQDGSDTWTLENLPSSLAENVSTESHIVLNPNYHSLLDFACYGNCTKLIESAVLNIIKNFPAELYISNEQVIIDENGQKAYLIKNPFNIDIVTKSISKIDNEANELRYFCRSLEKYQFVSKNGKKKRCIEGWESKIYDKCIKQLYAVLAKVTLTDIDKNKIEIKQVVLTNGPTLVLSAGYEDFVGTHIRPIESIQNEFFDSLENIEKILLNRNTTPKYTADLDYPFETEYGLKSNRRLLTWPVNDGWNLDINSHIYSEYVNSLLKLSHFYDENFTDNLWRMYTHDSIKSMDITFTRSNADENNEDYILGTTRLQGVIWACGREFDDLKQYIDNIRNTNVLTYSRSNNIPDYFLSDIVGLSGWEVKSVNETLSDEYTTPILFKGEGKKYDKYDLNIEFLKNLKLNSKYILSKKGTRAGIESLLGLFGLVSYDYARNLSENWNSLEENKKQDLYDYKICEYVEVATPTDELCSADTEGRLYIEQFNGLKYSYPTETPENEMPNTMAGLPARIVELQQILEDGTSATTKYVIPWFDKTYTYDGNVYFQMHGGWGKQTKKKVQNEDKEIEIVSDDKIKIYEETLKYLNIIDDVPSLERLPLDSITDEEIYYVNNVDEEIYSTHYFIWKTKSGSTENEWQNISASDMSATGLTSDGIKVLYLESLIDEYRGNNPHVGYGKYDDGEAYLNAFRKLLGWSIENDNFSDEAYDCATGGLYDIIPKLGFNLTENEDNVKCWYFVDKYRNSEIIPLKEVVNWGYNEEYIDFPGGVSYSETTDTPIRIGSSADTFFESHANTYDFEEKTTGSTEEAAAYSIINTKKIKILFCGTTSRQEGFKEYLYSAVFPYLKQVIPSTAIVEISIEGENASFACSPMARIIGISN